MQCPCCYSTQTFKNGFRKGRQCYKCKQCGRQFLESYQAWCYSNDVKQLCLKMHLKTSRKSQVASTFCDEEKFVGTVSVHKTSGDLNPDTKRAVCLTGDLNP
ncbi:IS1/IS1595 family N-terminal zinc-binding domain-containing protein [Nostoc sp.]